MPFFREFLHRQNSAQPVLLLLSRNLSSQPQYLAYQKVEIVVPGTVVVDRDPQAMLAMDRRIGKGGDALLLQPQHDLGVERLQARR